MRRARICLIDDDVIVLSALAACMREAGYDVLTAPGAAAGLDAVEREGADIIITDMSMPGTNGAQLIAQARANWPSMPIIAISGESRIDGADIADAARRCGADVLLAKPIRASELSERIDSLLAQRAG